MIQQVIVANLEIMNPVGIAILLGRLLRHLEGAIVIVVAEMASVISMRRLMYWIRAKI
jgi:hypothetical protein